MPSRGLHALSLATRSPTDRHRDSCRSGADVGRQPIGQPPVVVDEPGVRQEVGALALLDDRVPLDGRGAVAEEDRNRSFSPAPVPERIAPALMMR